MIVFGNAYQARHYSEGINSDVCGFVHKRLEGQAPDRLNGRQPRLSCRGWAVPHKDGLGEVGGAWLGRWVLSPPIVFIALGAGRGGLRQIEGLPLHT